MGNMRDGCKRLCALFICLAISAGNSPAEDSSLSPLHIKADYRFTVDGLPFGQMQVEVQAADGRYRIDSHIRSTYLARLFERHESHATVSGNYTGRLEDGDRVFESAYDNDDDPNRIRLAYQQGHLTSARIDPPDPPGKRPPVEPLLFDGSVDLLSFVLAARQHLRDALATHASAFQVKLFDGRRLMTIFWTVKGKTRIKVAGKPVDVIACSLRREATGGFTPKELKRLAKGEPPLTVYFSDDQQLWPVLLRLDMWFGPVEATRQPS